MNHVVTKIAVLCPHSWRRYWVWVVMATVLGIWLALLSRPSTRVSQWLELALAPRHRVLPGEMRRQAARGVIGGTTLWTVTMPGQVCDRYHYHYRLFWPIIHLMCWLVGCGSADEVADNLILGSGLDGEGDGDYDEEEAMMMAEKGVKLRPEQIYENDVEDDVAERRAEELADKDHMKGRAAGVDGAGGSRSIISFSPEDYEISASV
jgi:hypothetical protein